MDYAFLRQEGIHHLERMAGQLWTDFNAHDPGITILEQVCYALTDLAYRINYPLPNLLAGSEGQAEAGLFSPAQILTSYPVTLTDLRKLVIDVEGVRNAWIEPAETQEVPLYYDPTRQHLRLEEDEAVDERVHLKGLYRVFFELDGSQTGDVRQPVVRRLHAHRGLGEDFVVIRTLNPQLIDIEARIEIGAVDDAGAVMLVIFQRLTDHISPPVRFYTLQERLDAGKRIDEIFDGPQLAHGFIDPEELQQALRRTSLRTSDLLQEIMDVPGVKAVRTISIASGGAARQPWLLDLDPAQTPRFNLDGSRITLEHNGLPVRLNLAELTAIHKQRQLASTAYRKLAPAERDLSPPAGRAREIGRYTSIQHQFPATYGIGTTGLPESATPRRKAQARQLKAYLLFFDQLLANYFAQLARTKDLLSASMRTTHTYFSQPIIDPGLELGDILQLDPAELQQITENPDPTKPDFSRRQRFLNHLLARFAEQFTEYSLLLYDDLLKGEDNNSDENGAIPAAEKLIQDKQAFLQDYPHLSRARGTAFNYLEPWSAENQSGLAQRLRRKLGLTEPDETFHLVEHILLRPMTADQTQLVPILEESQFKDPYSLRVSFVFPAWPRRLANPAFRGFVESTIREETPAHLTLTIYWLERPAMENFESAYLDWLEKRRAFWKNDLGV